MIYICNSKESSGLLLVYKGAYSVSIRKQYLIHRYKNKVYIVATTSGLLLNNNGKPFLNPEHGAMEPFMQHSLLKW
jgi:hypothetical protein